MKKIFLVFLAAFVLAIAGVISFYFGQLSKNSADQSQVKGETTADRREVLRIALIADSHNDNGLLREALRQVQGKGINFVIGLGDYTDTGTMEELLRAKEVFDSAKMPYYLTAGDHDLWDSRNRGEEPLSNFGEVFGEASRVWEQDGVQFVILDNSDIYKGISAEDWEMLEGVLPGCSDNSKAGLTAGKKRSAGLNSNSKLSLRLAQAFVPPDVLLQDSGFYWRDSVMFLASGKPVFASTPSLCFVFSHKTPFHPDSAHVMGEDSAAVRRQAERLLAILEGQGDRGTEDIKKRAVDGFFSGDLHFFAKFSSKGGSTSGGNSPDASVKMTTIGAIDADRNFQGPRFGVLTIWEDFSWEVEDMEIR